MTRLVALARTYPTIVVTLVVAAIGGALHATGHPQAARWAISLYVLAIALRQLVTMIRHLLAGHAGIDILAILAIGATVAVGEYWAALLIVLMLTGGAALEDYAEARAKRELTALLDRAPDTAHRRTCAGETEDVPVARVVVGDELLVRPGEVVPVDGALLSPRAAFDESQLTGEPVPVEKTAGDFVLSGSVNAERAIVLRASARAEDSQYQRIVRLVADAQASRAPTVRLADRYAVPFTFVALAVAALAWWVSGNPVRAAEVLVVATPCPLLLAAPIAFIGGMSRAARSGIIVKGGGTLEELARTRTVAFDKTGTLTHGHPDVADVVAEVGHDPEMVLALAAAADSQSVHVLAHALVAAARGRGLALETPQNVTEEAGRGVSARVAGHHVLVGRRRWLAEHSVVIAGPTLGPGQVGVFVALDGHAAGTIVLADAVRPEARATLDALRDVGIEHTLMLTGDGAATARNVADELDIERVVADCLPQDKVDAVASLVKRPVMMVGDGVNDAPVLAVADVGVAMGAKGSTASSEAADVVIMLDDLSRVARAVTIGRRTLRVALQSIWLGIALSEGLMLVAAFGLLPALAGAGLQEIVDLACILLALRALSGGREGRQLIPRPTPTSDRTAPRATREHGPAPVG